MSTDEIVQALRICELHESELEPVAVPAFRGCLDYAPEYVNEMTANFPHSTLDQVMVPDSFTEHTVTIWVCSSCDEALNSSRWRKR